MSQDEKTKVCISRKLATFIEALCAYNAQNGLLQVKQNINERSCIGIDYGVMH